MSTIDLTPNLPDPADLPAWTADPLDVIMTYPATAIAAALEALGDADPVALLAILAGPTRTGGEA